MKKSNNRFTTFTVLATVVALILLAALGFTREKPGSERERMMLNKAAVPQDFLVRCEVGNVGVLLHYDTGIGQADLSAPSFEYPTYSDNHYLYAGNFWYRYKDAQGEIRGFPTGDLAYISDAAGVTGIETSSATADNSPDWAISHLDTKSEWYDLYDADLNQNGSNVYGTIITHAWSESYRDDWILWEMQFVNRGDETINDFYIGKRMDCDVSSWGGGSGAAGFWRDDLTGYYVGTDETLPTDQNVYISYEFDGDNPTIPGDDTGGWQTPKESMGFIGTITITCPPNEDWPENRMAGHSWWDWNSDPSSPAEIYGYLEWGHNNPSEPYRPEPPSPHDYRYLSSWGPYDMEPGDTVKIRIATGIGEAPQEYISDPGHSRSIGEQGIVRNLSWAKRLYQMDWVGPSAPPAPTLNHFIGHNEITLIWDESAETALDPISGVADFEGYKLWKSTDAVNWELLLQIDKINDIGRNTGLVHQYTDYAVQDGYNYFYSITAYDRGDPGAGVESLESSLSTARIQVMPGPESEDKLSEDKVVVVPNPYYAHADWNWEPSTRDPAQHRIGFFGLPEHADIYIYTLSGDYVDKIEHRDPTSGVAYWDCISENIQTVVSGVYLYVIEDKDGNKIRGKFIIVK